MKASCCILRLRQSGVTFDCELIDPTSMQILCIHRRKPEITNAIRKTIPAQYAGILRMMRKKGKVDITEFRKALTVLQKEIAKILKPILEGFDLQLKAGCNIGLALDDETVRIPWELGFIKQRPYVPFCESAGIGRLRTVESDRWFDIPSNRRTYKALVVGLDYKDCRSNLGTLDHPQEEAEQVRTILENHKLNVKLLKGKRATRQSVVRELKKGVDIFHFTGHGDMSGRSAKILLSDDDLCTKDIDKEGISCVPALSFLNACWTSFEQPSSHDVRWASYNWANCMALNGGKAFVGTLWPVLDSDSSLFARVFYEEILGGVQGKKTFAEAMNAARRKVKNSNDKDCICTWPAYVLYGLPNVEIDGLLAAQ